MAWELSGQLIEACSCKSACPCALGPAEPDQGWCSGALTFAIDEGQSDGVDLSGRTSIQANDLGREVPQAVMHSGSVALPTTACRIITASVTEPIELRPSA